MRPSSAPRAPTTAVPVPGRSMSWVEAELGAATAQPARAKRCIRTAFMVLDSRMFTSEVEALWSSD